MTCSIMSLTSRPLKQKDKRPLPQVVYRTEAGVYNIPQPYSHHTPGQI